MIKATCRHVIDRHRPDQKCRPLLTSLPRATSGNVNSHFQPQVYQRSSDSRRRFQTGGNTGEPDPPPTAATAAATAGPGIRSLGSCTTFPIKIRQFHSQRRSFTPDPHVLVENQTGTRTSCRHRRDQITTSCHAAVGCRGNFTPMKPEYSNVLFLVSR